MCCLKNLLPSTKAKYFQVKCGFFLTDSKDRFVTFTALPWNHSVRHSLRRSGKLAAGSFDENMRRD